ncbi:MAG: tetratricopeptide repeat protein [Candidatus Bathyarchaeota archaeon]|nr:MAG: tetratricopeptide repeat protein [Candidatus Bathyarchaeota archaeon]
MSSSERRIVVPGPRPVAVREIQLINRKEEMQALREAVDRAAGGQGGVIFLHGEAGIGKTRLARELGAYARSRGMQVLSGRCPALFRMDGVPPYVLWEEVIKNYLETCTPEQLFRVVGSYPVEVSKLVPELKQKLRTLPQSFPLSPEHSRDRLFEAVSQLIINVSRETPLLVILDDLQWTDESSLLLLHYLARSVSKESLLLLGAFRHTYVDKKHPLTPVLAELNRERLLQSVRLKRLAFDDVLEMVKRILEQDDHPRKFCELVYRKTRGNPFFVEEVIKSLKEDEIIYRQENKWKIKEVAEIKFPETVKDVIKARISRLDEECQRVLTLASFVGKDFTFEALRGITRDEEEKLLELTEKMLKTGLIEERINRGESVFSFADIIVRDVVYDEVSFSRRKRTHGAVGIALEKVYVGNIEEHYGELAYHFLESGDKNKALDYFLKAGEKARKVYALDEAFSYYEHALKLLKEDDIEQRAGLTERLGDLKGWMGERIVGMEYWEKSLAFWSQVRNKKDVARLHVKIANALWMWAANKEKASENHRRALEILEKEPESVELANLYEDISHMLWRTGDLTEALPWAKKAFELAEKLGALKVLAQSYNNLGVLSGKFGEGKKSTEYLEQGLKIALENNFAEQAFYFYNNLAELYWVTGEFKRGFEMAERGLEHARKVGALGSMVCTGSTLAVYYLRMGEIQKGISMLEDFLVLDKRAKFTTHIAYVMASLGVSYYWLGEWDKSLQYLVEAQEIAQKTGEYQASGTIAFFLGELFKEMEDYVEAEKYFNKCNSIAEKAGETDFQLTWVFPALSKLHLRKGEIQKAKELVEKTYEYAEKTRNRLVVSLVEMLKAMIFRDQREWEQSIQYFEKSLQGYRSLNVQKWTVQLFAELLYEYGLMYLERNAEGDKKKGSSLLNQALEVYLKMDAKKMIEKTELKIAPLEVEGRIVKLEPMAEETFPSKIATGYDKLDELLLGGIPRGHAAILTSPSCDERDSLIRHFLEAGAKRGQTTFYVTIDPSQAKHLTEEYKSHFRLFVCNPETDPIIETLPNVSKLKGVENLNEINIALASAFRGLGRSSEGIRRACIDIVSDVLLQHHAVSTRRWLTALIPQLKARGFTTLAMMNPQMHSPQEVQAILGLFEGEINLYEKETEKGFQKFLRIKKMTNQKYSKSELLLQEKQPQE